MFRWLVGLGTLLASSNAWAGGVAVLFQNQGNVALEPLKVGLAQMLVTDLQAGSELPIIERAELQAVSNEFKLGHDGIANPASAARVGKLVGAEYFVIGTYFELFGTLRIDTRVVEVEDRTHRVRLRDEQPDVGVPDDGERRRNRRSAHQSSRRCSCQSRARVRAPARARRTGRRLLFRLRPPRSPPAW